jgi:hypothetical protein
MPGPPDLHSVAADGSYRANGDPNYTASWYRILTAGFAGARRPALLPGNGAWLCNVIAFKSETGSARPASGRYWLDIGISW